MNKIERMLQELCPEGVEYKKLGEVCEFQRGSTITAKKAVDGDVPVIAGGQKPAYYHNVANRQGKTVVVAGSGAYAGFVTYWEIPIFVSDAFSVNPNDCLDTKYLYYYLKNIQEKIHATKKGSGVPHVHGSSIAKFEIPVPPLPIQEEIVRILDHFTELTASLQAELQARQKQYEYYRNRLLTFTKIRGGTQSVIWMKMSEICNLQRGKVYSKEYLRDNQGIYPVYSSQTINNGELGRISTYDFDGTYLTWTTDGAYAGTIFKRKGKFSITNVCGIISMKSDLVTMDFLYYWLSLKAKEYVYSGMGNPKLMSNQVEKILVPIPVLSEQQRIVGILDKFETLVNDLSQGLPAEIAAVQEQYEYYRNKLLTFNRIQSN